MLLGDRPFQTLRKPGKWVLPTLSLICLAVVVAMFCAMWNPGTHWKGGIEKGHDLVQHYLAGQMVNAGKMSDLWHDSLLLKWEIDYPINPDRPTRPEYRARDFNYVYPPLVVWGMSHLVWMEYGSFYAFWMVTGLLAAGAAIVLLEQKKFPLTGFILLGGFPALAFSLILGQNTLLSLLVIVGTGVLLDQRRFFLAGLVLSLMFYKPPILFVLGILFLIAGWYGIAAGLLLGTLFWQGVTVMLCGWDALVGWLGVIQKMSSGGQSMNVSLLVTWAGVLWSFGLEGNFWKGLVVVGGFLTLGWLAWRLRRSATSPNALFFYLLVMACIPLMPYALSYEILLCFPAYAVLEKKMRMEDWGRWPEFVSLFLVWWMSLFSLNILPNTHMALTAPFLSFVAIALFLSVEKRSV